MPSLSLNFKQPMISGPSGGFTGPPTQRLTPLEQLRLMAMTSAHPLGSAANYVLNPMRPSGEMQMPAMYILSPQDKLRYMASATPLQEESKLSESRQAQKRAMKQEPAPDKVKEE